MPEIKRRSLYIRLVPSALASPAQRHALERDLPDRVAAMGLELGGAFPACTVAAASRVIPAADQVDLIDWLIDRPGLAALAVAAAGIGVDAVELSLADLDLIGLAMLHRMRRISAPQYLQILGSFVRQAVH